MWREFIIYFNIKSLFGEVIMTNYYQDYSAFSVLTLAVALTIDRSKIPVVK